MQINVSVIVLTYNRSDAALAVLRALAGQCLADDEVIIADDGSRPEHVRVIQEGLPIFQCDVQHIWHPDIGFTAAKARNLGILKSKNDYIIFLDGDCVPHAHFLAQHRRLAQPGHFVNGSRVLLSPSITDRVLSQGLQVQTWRWPQWLLQRLSCDTNKCLWLLGAKHRLPLDFLRAQSEFKWRGIRSCNLAAWRSDLTAVNGFDAIFAGWGHEDADLVLRLHHAGLIRKNGFWATEVFHLHHSENARLYESKNRAIVIDRIASRISLAQVGLQQLDDSEVVIQYLLP